jgi:alpha-L-fucosidase
MGGNMLLDVGPKSDGSLQPEQVAVLKGLGRWTSKHAEALYGTTAGLPAGYFLGTTTLSKNRDVLYLYYFDKPMGPIALKGIRNKVRRMSVLGGKDLTWTLNGGASWLKMPGVHWINLPEDSVDPDATVIKVELDGPLDLAVAPKVNAP